ncbi:hypothetical protein [uncultured Eudoraea sp.]|uniref:hypothetical protein n=1 Tax=uncultured Eudoraea sp. TaxID=1035614 RepID=UPI002606B855|nr:hypothetical protein [uncultured Eudoraea sp.]
MISGIFGKTKPINFIILQGFLFVFYWFVNFVLNDNYYEPEKLVVKFVVLGILLFSVFAVDFIVKRNQITATNSFAILYFTLLIVIFPEVLLDDNAVFCNFFLLLALRRLISLKSLKNIKLKVFDATIWTLIASLFYDWAILYLILVGIAIYFYEPKNIKNWLVPLAGIFTIGIILYCFLLITDNLAFLSSHYQLSLKFDVVGYWMDSTKLAVYGIITFIGATLVFIKMSKLGMGKIITMRLIAISLVLGFTITFLKTSDDIYPVLITFCPGAIFLAKYVELIKRTTLKEIVLMVSLIAPFLILITEMIVK